MPVWIIILTCPVNRNIFNALKAEYLAYFRDITLLREKHDLMTPSFNKRREKSPPEYTSRYRKKRSPSPARWERKERSPSPQMWRRKPLSPAPERPVRRFEAAEDEYPRGCVVFFKRLHPEANTRTLRALFQDILESEEMEREKLQYVDHVRNVDSVGTRNAAQVRNPSD